MYINCINDNFSKKARIMVVIIISGNTTQAQLQRAQKIQNFAAKVALGGAKFDHATPYFQELK